MISVIIPVFNAEKYIDQAITSILNQTFQDFEVLIADDASSDESFQIINKFSSKDTRIKVFRNNENLGYLKTINFLAKKAKGKYIAFQDADDYSHSKRLQIQVEFLDNNKDYGIVGTNFRRVDNKGKIIQSKKDVISSCLDLQKELLERNPFQKPSIMFRSIILSTVGMFREEFLQFKNISEDFDWILRVAEKFKVGNINYSEPLYTYRSSPMAMTKSFNHPEQLFGEKVCLFLAKERLTKNIDSIESSHKKNIINLIDSLKAPYIKDKSLFFHEKAGMLMYSGLKKEALTVSIRAIKANPKAINNWRLFFYCLRNQAFNL